MLADPRTDGSTPLHKPRLQQEPATSSSSSTRPMKNPKSFRHYTLSTLSHLLALILHPPREFFHSTCGLLVIEGLNALVDLDYPRYLFTNAAKSEPQKWQAGRRYAILGSLVTALNKLAVLSNIAVVVTTGCATRMRPDSGLGAALMPGIGGAEWDSGIWNRLAVFRDFEGRFIGISKCRGKSLISREEVGEVGRIVGFNLDANGHPHERQLGNATHGDSAPRVKLKASPLKSMKRSFDEIADSESEDLDEYGWAETDEDAVAGDSLAADDSQPIDAEPEPV